MVVVMVVRLRLRRRVPVVLVIPVLVVVLLLFLLLLMLLLWLVVMVVVVVQMVTVARGRRATGRRFFLAARHGRRTVVCLRQYRVLELSHQVTGAMLGAHRLEHAAADRTDPRRHELCEKKNKPSADGTLRLII